MATRQTIGENPLDALIPQPQAIPRSGVQSAPRDASAASEVSAPRRAAASAVQQQQAAAPAQCLTFYLAGEEYAIGILRIREIVEYENLILVPATPTWIRGVMNLRGNVVPVIDLAVKLGLPETEIAGRTCIVIVEVDLEGEQTVMGVMVDEVHRVLDLGPEDVEQAPAFGTRVHVDYLLGMGKVGEKLVLILDLERVLSRDQLLTADAAQAAACDSADSCEVREQ